MHRLHEWVDMFTLFLHLNVAAFDLAPVNDTADCFGSPYQKVQEVLDQNKFL